MDTEQAEFSPEPHKRVGRDTRELEFSPEAPRQIERDEVEMQEEMQEEMQDEIHDGAVHHESEIRHEEDLEQDADGHIHHKGPVHHEEEPGMDDQEIAEHGQIISQDQLMDQVEGQLVEIRGGRDHGNQDEHNIMNIAEGSQIVIIGQDASELSSLQDMGNHPIVIYNEDGSSVIYNKATYSEDGNLVLYTDQDMQLPEGTDHEYPSIPAISDQLPEMLLSNEGNKDGVGNRNDVDIQYHGESEITIRLKGDQPQPKTGLKRKASRRKRQPQQDDGESPRKYLAGEDGQLVPEKKKRGRKSKAALAQAALEAGEPLPPSPEKKKPRGSRGRKSKNAERTAQQENEDEIIARVIEERIEGEVPEDQDMQIVLDDMDREQLQYYEDGQYGTMEVRAATRDGRPHPSCNRYTDDTQLQNVTRSKFWKEIEEWVPEPKTKRMRLTQEEMTQQPAEGFLPLDPYFMVCDPLPCGHPECRLYPSLLYLREIYPRGHGIRQMFHLPEGIESRVAEDNSISACPSKGFGAGVIIGCVVGRTVTLQDAATHKKPESLWPVYVDSKIHHYVDTSSRIHSNWTRLVRHSSLKEIVNLVVLQSFGTQYLLTVRRIDAGDELVVWTNRNLCMDTSAMDFQQLACPGIYWRQRTLRKIHYHVCYECGSMFKSPIGIQDHVRHVHNSMSHKPNIVTVPPETNAKQLQCKKRLNKDGKKEGCPTCSFIYKRSFLSQVTKGNMRHFKCMTCFKRYYSSACHKKHMTNNKHRISAEIHTLCDYVREAVEEKRLPLSDPDVMAAARPRIPRNSEYPIPPAKPFASANDIIVVDGKRYDTQVPLTDPFFKEMFQTRVNTYPYIHRLQATTVADEDNCTMLEIHSDNKKPMYTTRRGRPQKAVKKMLEEAINPQGVTSPHKGHRMFGQRVSPARLPGSKSLKDDPRKQSPLVKQEMVDGPSPRNRHPKAQPMVTQFSTGFGSSDVNYPAPPSSVWDRPPTPPPAPEAEEEIPMNVPLITKHKVTALPTDNTSFDFNPPRTPEFKTPRLETKFGEVFEPFIEEVAEEPAPVTTSGGETVPSTPTPEKPKPKPSPSKTHKAPPSFKKSFAGKSLKDSLLDAFDDAVFGTPKKKK